MKTRTTLFIWDLMRHSRMIFALLLLGGIVFAADTDGAMRIKCAMQAVCELLDGLVPFIAFTLFVIAGVIYGAGQFFGADMRAKASSYAMTAITGAIIMIILYLIGPTIINALYGGTDISETGARCDFGCTEGTAT